MPDEGFGDSTTHEFAKICGFMLFGVRMPLPAPPS